MKGEVLLSFLAFSAINEAAPVFKAHVPVPSVYVREVPQEHSHNVFLDSVRTSLAANNPDNIQDPVFGLLGNAAGAAGQGSITDTDCLHQATADQAFTNAKATGDVKGMTDALIYAALERNTGKVGLASVTCTAIKATNPEIAAISQHQVCICLHVTSMTGAERYAGSSFSGCRRKEQGCHARLGETDCIYWRRSSASAQGRNVRSWRRERCHGQGEHM